MENNTSPTDRNISKALDFMDKIPSVKNGADISTEQDQQPVIDYCECSSSYWREREPKYKSQYDKGFAAGKHVVFDTNLFSSTWKIITKLKSDILTNLFRNNDKSVKHVKFMLDILKSLDDNIDHVMKTENIKAEERELVAYIHGFINAIVKNKTSRETNESSKKSND